MSRDPQAKRRKELGRRKKLKEEQLRRRPPEFPPLVVAANDAEPGFVELVRRAVADVDFRDSTAFDPWNRELYRTIVSKGWAHAQLRLAATARAAGPHASLVYYHFSFTLDDWLYAQVLQTGGIKYLPMHELQTVLQDRRVLVNLRSLCRAKGSGGTVYHSSHRPTVRLGGRDLVVAFSGHALQRAADRATPTWRHAAGGLTDAFALFEYCLDFEPWTQPGGGPGFVLWENCRRVHFSDFLARSVLGEAYLAEKEYRYRVGYCPAVVEGDFLKAKTMLFPGYRGTPEFELLLESPLPSAERAAMFQMSRGLDMATLHEREGLDLIRWYHEQGVLQISEGSVRFAPQPLQALAPAGANIQLTRREAERIEEFGRRHAGAVVRAAIARRDSLRRTSTGEDQAGEGSA